MDEQKNIPASSESKDSAHQEEINRLNAIVGSGGKLDEVEEESKGIQVQKAHKDLVVSQDKASDLLRMKLKDATFPLSDPDKADIKTVENLFEELVEAKIAVGLAAQQANVTVRVCCIKMGSDHITMINPHVIARKGKKKGWESCLSIPAVVVEITRPRNITVEYYDMDGERHILSPMLHKHCRRMYHEYEHLEGRMVDIYVKPDGSNVRIALPDWA